MESVKTVARLDTSLIESTQAWATIEDRIDGFRKGVQLYPHQETIIRSLCDLEDGRVLTINQASTATRHPLVAESASCVLSEPFGSGKTIMLLGLILSRPIPKRAIPVHVNIPKSSSGTSSADKTSYFQHDIVRIHTGPSALIRPTLIVVGAAVLVQWERAIEQFTTLRVLVVGDFYGVVEFRKHFQARTLSRYDVVLLKNGAVTGKLDLKDGKKDYRSMVSAIDSIVSGSCWARVIYDDFDTIMLPGDAVALDALFSVYVSSSKRVASTQAIKRREFASIADAIMDSRPHLKSVTCDPVLFGAFNVRNTADYTRDSMSIPRAEGFRYVYVNPDDNYIGLLGAMDDEEATRIMEMLNGDAVETAAGELGIEATSVAEIFQRVLDKKWVRYRHDITVLAVATKMRDYVDRLPVGVHTLETLDTVRASIVKGVLPQVQVKSATLVRDISDIIVEYTRLKDEDGRAVERVISNVKEGECQICCLPLEGSSVFIIKCCGLIVCSECGVKGTNLKKAYDYKSRTTTVHGACANCRATIYPKTDLVFLDQNFDIEQLINTNALEDEPVPVDEPVNTSAPIKQAIRNPKLRALLAIIRGEVADEREKIDLNIPHLVAGTKNIPGTGPRKVLVFANYNETLKLVEDFLGENSIEFLRLGGTYHEKAKTIEMFKHRGQVLIVNSQETCAGVNAQFATDLVFMHKIMDTAVEGQVAGRLQRIGRTCNARFHYLCYKNEAGRV